MKQLGVDLLSTFGQDVLTHMDNDNPKQQHPFMLAFKNIWADNGDVISIHYAGTGSVISTVTRTGKKDFFGMIDHASKTISRFYIGNFEDQVKQEAIDMLLGQHTESINGKINPQSLNFSLWRNIRKSHKVQREGIRRLPRS